MLSATVQRGQALFWAAAVGFVAIGALAAARGSWLVVAALVAGVVGLIALARPVVFHFGVLAALLLDDFGAIGIGIGNVPFTLVKLVGALSVGAWLIHAPVWNKPFFRLSPTTVPFALVLVSMLLSLVQLEPHHFEGDAFRDLVSVTSQITFLHYVLASFDAADLRPLLRTMAVTIGLGVLSGLVSEAGVERASGTFGNANAYAMFVLLFGSVSIGTVAGDVRGWGRTLLLALLVTVVPLAIYQSGSRASVLVLLGITPFLAWVLRRDLWLFGLVGIALVFVAPLAVDVDSVLNRFLALTGDDVYEQEGAGVDSIEGRAFFVELAWELFLERPLTGWGVGGFYYQSSFYFPGIGGRDAHNAYMQILAEQGLIGVVIHGWLFLTIARELFLGWWNAPSAAVRSIMLGFIAALLSYAVNNVASGRLMTSAGGYFVLALALVAARLRHGGPLPANLADPVSAGRSTPRLSEVR